MMMIGFRPSGGNVPEASAPKSAVSKRDTSAPKNFRLAARFRPEGPDPPYAPRSGQMMYTGANKPFLTSPKDLPDRLWSIVVGYSQAPVPFDAF